MFINTETLILIWQAKQVYQVSFASKTFEKLTNLV